MDKGKGTIIVNKDSNIKLEIHSNYGITMKEDLEFHSSDECKFLLSFYDQIGKINVSDIDSTIFLSLIPEYNSHIIDLIAKLDGPKIRNHWFPSNMVKTLKYLFDSKRNVKILCTYLFSEDIYTINNYDSSIIARTFISSNKWLNILPLDLKHKT